MKKNGFTLAEVLITLAIIGVVATMTLPALMSNTQEQQAKTAYKKAINTLTEAAQMNLALDNFDYSQLKQGYGDLDNYTDNDMSLSRIFANRLAVDFDKSVVDASIDTVAGYAYGQTIYLRDGSALLVPTGATINPEDYTVKLTDKLVKGFPIIFDMNGAKAPNILSNCLGDAAGAIDTDSLLAGNVTQEEAGEEGGTEGGDAKASACSNKGDRVIGDQFIIKLRGNVAQPDGAMANWIYNN